MKYNTIHIFGASGSGTTTLGKRISERYGLYHLDADDYIWLQTDPMFTQKREPNQSLYLLSQDLIKYANVVISGTLINWGIKLIPKIDLAIRIEASTEIRLKRIQIREHEMFGTRIDKGGDMYLQHLAFLERAACFDTGDENVRSRVRYDKWEKLYQCAVITLNGNLEVDENMKRLEQILGD